MTHVQFYPLSQRRRSDGASGLLLMLACLLVNFSLTCQAAKAPAGREELRRLASLPQMSFSAKAGFSALDRLRWEHETPDLQELAALRRQAQENPTNPESLLQVARWLREAGNDAQAAMTYSNAVALFRPQIEQRPQDARLRTHFGEALWGAGQDEEAEVALRNAARMAPDNPEANLLLGRFLSAGSLQKLLPDQSHVALPADIPQLLSMLGRLRPAPARFTAAEQRWAEALQCFNVAIQLAPRKSQLFEARARCRINGALIQALKTSAAAAQPDAAALLAATMSPDCLPDLRRAAELEPDNPRLIGAVAMFEGVSGFLPQQTRQLETTPNLRTNWKTLPPATVKSIREKLDRLNAIAQSKSAQAAEAAEGLGMLQLSLLQDYPQAEASFRRAVTLAPEREHSWRGLIAALASQQRPQELLRACEALVKQDDSATHRIFLAKAQAACGRWDKAVEQARLAAQRDPRSFLAHSTLIAALIRATDNQAAYLEAATHFALASQLASQASYRQTVQLKFTGGLLMALTGKVTEARRVFHELLQMDR